MANGLELINHSFIITALILRLLIELCSTQDKILLILSMDASLGHFELQNVHYRRCHPTLLIAT